MSATPATSPHHAAEAVTRRLQILQICPTMYEAGTWFRCFYLARGLARRGHDVTLLKVSPDSRFSFEESSRDGVRIVETPRFWGSSVSHHNTRIPSDVLARIQFILRQRFDVLHTYSHHVNAMLPGLLGRLLHPDTALVVDWDDLWTEGGLYDLNPHSTLLQRISYQIDRLSERHLKRLGDAVTVVSRDLANRCLDHGVPPERIHTLPNGAPADTIFPADMATARARLGFPAAGQIALFVGYGQYDLDMVFGAARLLQAEGLRFLLAICGPHGDKVQEMAEHAGLGGMTRVVGLIPPSAVPEYLHAADVGLLPFADKPINRARWPIKLGDYLAAGLPIVTCAVGEMGPFVERWRAGVSTPPTVEGFAAGMRQLLTDPAPGEVRARARHAAEKTSWDEVAVQAEGIYLRAVARS